MNKIKHFIWDFDGTLFDTYPVVVNAFQKALEDCGVVADKQDIYKLMMDSIIETFHYYINRYSLDQSLGERYQLYVKDDVNLSQPFQHAKDLCRLITVAGANNYLYTHRGNTTNHFFEKYGFKKYFTELVTSENGLKRKPDPEALIYLLHRYNMKKEETIMIGDRELDILCGKNAGVFTCYIQNGLVERTYDADYFFPDIDSFYKYMKEIHIDRV